MTELVIVTLFAFIAVICVVVLAAIVIEASVDCMRQRKGKSR